MEVERIISSMDCARKDDDDVPLPGFRFHPTDEELVGFYLRRKVEKRPISIELIKQVDIYKYDPWDLPKASNVGDKEWYFFCKRGRKYRNSIRPNRVTGSGFWKATGIDRPIYNSEGRQCIGLKKSLVYYRGSAGKGTKTDWMMHEFRLPADHDDKSTKHVEVKNIVCTQEAEVWTICRILKRSVSQRKCVPDWRDVPAKRNNNNSNAVDASSKTCSADSDSQESNYIDFRSAPAILQSEKKQFVSNHNFVDTNHQMLVSQWNSRSSSHQAPTPAPYSSSLFSPEMNDFIKYGDWDELRSVLEFAVDSIPHVNNMY